ncbi:hypothetical protein CLV78_102425 [Aliiruegeria haliotis]|uniref:Uncharacterized protein n=1 Tax=Aliiruegeria haliotis TaxID=1280846 RepID=A0A2T0RVS3_9RHOB|nr:hypothetical protein [Aliiruegeria haliotis]PRY25248.1 hypothetical protein CLV78_102425 [Aliiruegeria haliotis]
MTGVHSALEPGLVQASMIAMLAVLALAMRRACMSRSLHWLLYAAVLVIVGNLFVITILGIPTRPGQAALSSAILSLATWLAVRTYCDRWSGVSSRSLRRTRRGNS